MLRCSGGRVRAFDDTNRSPTWISPSEGSRKPAISRSVVVLPQPDGPSRQTSCPWSIRSETSSTTVSGPKRLVRPRNSTDATHFLHFRASLCERRGVPFSGIVSEVVYALKWRRRNAWIADQAVTLSPSHLTA